MSRVGIAHLSIERAMKFVITEADGGFVKNHDFPLRLKELREHEPESAMYIEKGFHDAVRHYRYNAKAFNVKHLKSLAKRNKARARTKRNAPKTGASAQQHYPLGE